MKKMDMILNKIIQNKNINLDDLYFHKDKCILTFAFIKEYNLFSINPKIYRYKGAFQNLGFELKKVEKKKILVKESDLILVDFKVIDNHNDFIKITSSHLFPKYLGILIISKKQVENVKEQVLKLIESYFKNQFDLSNLFDLLIDQQILMVVKKKNTWNLQYKLLLIEPSINPNKNELISLAPNEVILFGFPNVYSDYYSWKKE